MKKKHYIYILILIFSFILSQHIAISNDIADEKALSNEHYDIESKLEYAKKVFYEYHRDPKNFERAISLTNSILASDPDNIEALIFLSRIWLTYGHYLDGKSPEKWRRFEKGSEIAKKAIELNHSNPDSYFYYVANEASLAKSKGMFGSLLLISKLKGGLEKVLELDPNYTEAIAMKGAILSSIPGILGGNVKESEILIRKALLLDPKLTSTKIFLAKNLYKQKLYTEARSFLIEILDETNPRVEADWYLNRRVAIRMIQKIEKILHKES